MTAETTVQSDLKDTWLQRLPELPRRVFHNGKKWG